MTFADILVKNLKIIFNNFLFFSLLKVRIASWNKFSLHPSTCSDLSFGRDAIPWIELGGKNKLGPKGQWNGLTHKQTLKWVYVWGGGAAQKDTLGSRPRQFCGCCTQNCKLNRFSLHYVEFGKLFVNVRLLVLQLTLRHNSFFLTRN